MGDVTMKIYKYDDLLGDYTQTDYAIEEGSYRVKIDVAEGDSYAAVSNLTDENWVFTIYHAQHDWVYSVSEDGASIVSQCMTEGECPPDTQKPYMTLLPPDNPTYDGSHKWADIDYNLDFEEVPPISYSVYPPVNAGTYTASATTWQTLPTAEGETKLTVSLTYTIEPAPLTISSAGTGGKTYDGTTSVPINYIEFNGMQGSEILIPGTDFTVTGQYDDPNAGEEKPVSIVVTLLDTPAANNYVLRDNTFSTTAPITPAEIAPESGCMMSISNKFAGTYTFDLSRLLPELPAGCSYGSVAFTIEDCSMGEYAVPDNAPSVSGSTLSIPVRAVASSETGPFGSVTVSISGGNYVFTEAAEIALQAVNQIIPQGSPVLSVDTIPYGQPISTITLSGTMTDINGEPVPGAFAWEEPDAVADAGTHLFAWIFTPEDETRYLSISGMATVTVTKAIPNYLQHSIDYHNEKISCNDNLSHLLSFFS